MGNDVVCDATQSYSRNLTEHNYETLRTLGISQTGIEFYVCVCNLTCGETALTRECWVGELPFTLEGLSNTPYRVTVTSQSNMNAIPAQYQGMLLGKNRFCNSSY